MKPLPIGHPWRVDCEVPTLVPSEFDIGWYGSMFAKTVTGIVGMRRDAFDHAEAIFWRLEE